LGIERPKIRNGPAIASLNTLVYVLFNLQALQRIQQRPVINANYFHPLPEDHPDYLSVS